MREWVSRTGVPHVIDTEGRCATCGMNPHEQVLTRVLDYGDWRIVLEDYRGTLQAVADDGGSRVGNMWTGTERFLRAEEFVAEQSREAEKRRAEWEFFRNIAE